MSANHELAASYQVMVDNRDRLQSLVTKLEGEIDEQERALPGWDFRAELARLKELLEEADSMIAEWRKRLD